MRVSKRIREEYEKLFKDVGEDSFYQRVYNTGKSKKEHVKEPEVLLLNQSDAFFSLYRSTGKQVYFSIGVVLRKVAHKLYRENRQTDPKYPVNKRFLDLVTAS